VVTPMSDPNISERLKQAQARIASLYQRAGYSLLHQQGLLPDAFKELHITINELRAAEEELRAAENGLQAKNDALSKACSLLEAERLRYQDLFEFAPDGYFVTDLEGRILEANQAAASLLNIALPQLQNQLLSSYIYEEDKEDFCRQLSALQSESPHETSHHWTSCLIRSTSHESAGSIVTSFRASFTIVAAQIFPQEVRTLRWMVRDITDKQKAEEERIEQAAREAIQAEAKEAHRKITLILETITDTFVTLDREWRFTYLNSSAEAMFQAFGKDPKTVLGQIVWEVFPATLGTGFEIEGMRAVATRQMAEFEEYSPHLGRWLQIRIFPSESGIVAYTQDITARKVAELALREALEKERRVSGLLEDLILRTVSSNKFPNLSVETFYQAASGESRIGGDFCDVFTLGQGKVALVVGDVSGKGLQAAELSTEIKYVLRSILREVEQPAPAMARLNDFICEARIQGDLCSDHLVVLSLVMIDPGTGEAVCLSAGGDPILLLRKSGAVEPLSSGGLLLGVYPGVVYTENHFSFCPGDTLVLHTNGLTEARPLGPKTMLGYEGLRQLATRSKSLDTLHDMGQHIMEGAQTWAGGILQDDACLVLARRH
jgi:PAS domain S-box-containing protein